MEGYEVLGFLGILRETIKALSKNGRLITTITTISILLNSLLFFTKTSFTKPAIGDLIAKAVTLAMGNTTNSVDTFNEMKKDAQIIIGVEFIYLLPSLAISLFITVTMIIASAITYSHKKISFHDFLLGIPKSCLRTLVTSFHIKVFSVGYIVLSIGILMSLTILCLDHPLALMPINITLGFFASVFLIYLSVFWDMALVISVIEKSCYGFEALGKAGGLVKGNRLHGFGLTFLFAIVMGIISLVFRVDPNQKFASTQIILGFFATVFNCVVTMVYLMSYTVLYFQCKKKHGEEIELQGSLEYSKLPQI